MSAPSRKTSRRGVALLIVLAALLLTATATAMLAVQASAIRAQRNIDHCGMIADDMLRAAELPVMQWLSQKADSVVLPPDARCPRVLVLHDHWAVGTLEHELEIAAYDQCGMVPISVARGGSPLRLEVTSEMLATLDTMPSELIEDHPGLDSFADVASEQDRSPFPPSIPGDVATFGIAATNQSIEASPYVEVDDRLHIGQVMATHNSNPVRININTAPIPLLKAALRLAGMGDPELIIQSRQQGKPAMAPQTAHDQLISEFAPQIVARSTSWAFRIDIRTGPVRNSWWEVYEQSASPSSSDAADSDRKAGAGVGEVGGAGPGGWRCVQRVAILQ